MLTVMASKECKRCGRTESPIKYIKNLPTPKKQDIALFFHSSTRTSMARQKKFFELVVAACSASARYVAVTCACYL